VRGLKKPRACSEHGWRKKPIREKNANRKE
jgi:hypothetical protein